MKLSRWKKILALVISTFAATAILDVSAAYSSSCDISQGGFHRFSDNDPSKRVRGYVPYTFQLAETCTGVVTIRSDVKGADWDVMVGSRFDPETRTMHGRLKYENSSGVTDEVVVLPPGREWQVVVYPTTHMPSQGCVHFHAFDNSLLVAEAFFWATAQALLTELFSGEDSSESQTRNASRAASLGISALRGRNIGEMGYDFALSEVSSELAEAFGAGSWLFAFGVNYAGSYLTEVGKFSLLQPQKC